MIAAGNKLKCRTTSQEIKRNHKENPLAELK